MKNRKNNALNNILENKKKISCLIIVVFSTIGGTFCTQIHGKDLSEELDKKKEETRENFAKEIEEKAREVELEWLKEKSAKEDENKPQQLEIHISWDSLNKEEREELLGTDKKWSED